MKTDQLRLFISSTLTAGAIALVTLFPSVNASAAVFPPPDGPPPFYFKPTPGASRAENYAACIKTSRNVFVVVTCRLLYFP